MSITSAKSGATGISLALENNFMEPIASTLVGAGGSNTIIFNDIPQTYKHLQIRITAQTNRATYCRDTLRMALNGDSAANYADHSFYGDGGSAAGSANASANFMGVGTIGTSAVLSNLMFGTRVIDVLDYANASKNKTIRSIGGLDMNGTGTGGIGGLVDLASGLWQSLTPVTSITFTPAVGTSFLQYSRFSLYGIKG